MSEATLVYDDDCGFCTWWAEFFDERSDLEIVGFSEAPAEITDLLPADYEECSHLVTEDAVYSCGASIEEALARTAVGPDARSAVDFLRNFEDYGWLRERGYRWVADRRDLWGRYLSKTPPVRRSPDGEE